MNDPITIGAGLGAGLSVLSGKSPLTGALLGGAGGGLFGGLQPGGFLSNLTSGATPAVGATTGGSAFAPSFMGQVTTNPALLGQTVTPSVLSGVKAGAIPLSGLDRGINAVKGFTAPIENFAAENPFLARTGGNMLMNSLEGAPPPRTMQAPSPIPTQYNTSAQLDPSLVSMVQRKKYPYMIG
jgi:hypothetical protein